MLFRHTSALNRACSQDPDYGEIGDEFRVGASKPCDKVNVTITDENGFRLALM